MGTSGASVRDGLSPPTRGNQAPPAPPPELAGSIPAHAGEPPDSAAWMRL